MASNGYEAVPTVVTMNDVFTTPQGFVLSEPASEMAAITRRAFFVRLPIPLRTQ